MMYVFGWLHGGGEKMLFFRGELGPLPASWGVTDDFSQARRFDSLSDCFACWREMHSFPEDYEHCITNGYLFFFTDQGQQISALL